MPYVLQLNTTRSSAKEVYRVLATLFGPRASPGCIAAVSLGVLTSAIATTPTAVAVHVAKKVASRRARVRPMQPKAIIGKHDGTKSLLWTVDRPTLRTAAHVYMYTEPKSHRNMFLLAFHGNKKVLYKTPTLTRAATRYQVPVYFTPEVRPK